jgi:hypothetical protein
MSDVEVHIQSLMNNIVQRWDLFEEKFHLNNLYSIPELETEGHSPKDVLDELLRLAKGHWYEFYLHLLSPAKCFTYSQSVFPNLFKFIKTFGDSVMDIDSIILKKNFTAVLKDNKFFTELMDQEIYGDQIPLSPGYTISKWLKRFGAIESIPNDLSELLGIFKDEKIQGKVSTFSGHALSDIYIEAKHKIDWNSHHKFERKERVTLKQIFIAFCEMCHFMVLELPWQRVKNSYN